ncbi:MAG: hypothetical protein IJQ12_02515 [Lachnospiraceae bacterium]|nr:hypothetical protein [Lachnospiraceae bacterium]
MDLSPIGSVISSSRMGTRIPEEMLGLPARNARYRRDYLSMDPIEPVSRLRVQADTATQETAGSTDLRALAEDEALRGIVAQLAGTLPGTGTDAAALADPDAFRTILSQAIDAQTAQSGSSADTLLSDPEYYRNLMMLSNFSSGLLSNSLTGGLTTF